MSYWETIGKTNEYYTPKYIFDALDCSFDMDVAAPKDRTHVCVPAKKFITENSLELSWGGYVWMNPPFGGRNGLVPWLEKIYHHGNGIALTPDRTSAGWWQNAAKQADVILFVNGKIKFIKPNGKPGKQPSNGTTLFGYGPLACTHLRRAEQNGLGVLMGKNINVNHHVLQDCRRNGSASDQGSRILLAVDK